ncbi:putative glyoxalase superfamily protein PhnB [Dongia mobilis]|uniref:Putative glyoxalase superfamily protein PhnB n=1 Tax=Dongia mobilis TaxID=578943 RepID=A0A4R6WQC5_9PROT|nr:VOC family protein [Dongia mobilis]TDQ78578.1 putative glyoxalase superfamily protein PhnB [Dongia mobilis]
MQIAQYYPVLAVKALAAASAFYQQHFDFKVVFEADWYIHLQHGKQPDINLALLDCRHETIPEGYRKPAQGLLINFETDDVDAAYERAQQAGLPILLSLRDEAFGQRHFITRDPNGILIDVIKVIPPAAEFAQQYRAEA